MLDLFKPKEVKKQAVHATTQELTLPQWRATLLQLKAVESTNHYRMGEHYNLLVESKLAEAAGYKGAQDYISKELRDISAATLRTYGAVAARFSEDVARQFGVIRLSLLLTYKEAAAIQVDPREPGGTVIEVPGNNGEVKPTPFAQCGVEDLRKALQRLRKPASSQPLPEADLALAHRYREAVTGNFPKEVPVKVQLRNDGGTAVLDFTNIPLTQVLQLAQALMSQFAPGPQ
ncbi:MAG: hypothetical protein JXB05_16310 [Myxococcaceae bacterium]|nr:hypothetical protein [Myxococcaceae bacterium]